MLNWTVVAVGRVQSPEHTAVFIEWGRQSIFKVLFNFKFYLMLLKVHFVKYRQNLKVATVVILDCGINLDCSNSHSFLS